ncbi:MAG: ParA family protein [Chthonomonadales bacterium]|nr:ParA family protein [Chthonomonadales bacterium]
MITVSVVNQKGGVAKTTTCANLGACLAARGYRVLLVDLDPQANLTLGMGAGTADLPHGLPDVLLDWESCPLSPVLRRVGETTLYVAPGGMELARAEAMLLPLGGSAYRLRHALEDLAAVRPFDWVLIDCPPSLGRLTQNAIVASTHLLIPTEPKFYAFQGMDTLNRMIVDLTKDLRFGVELLGVLLTMYEKGTRLHRGIAEEIRTRFGRRVFDTVIYRTVRLSEAEVEGKPIIAFDRRSRGAQNYEALTDEVIARVGQPAK